MYQPEYVATNSRRNRLRDDGGTEGQPTTFTNDGMGRRRQTSFPDQSHEDSSYQFGQLKTWKTRKNQTKTIVYDARGREQSHSWDDRVTPAISRSWDDANRLASITNLWSSIDYGYDDAGQLIWEGDEIAGSGGRTQTNYYRYPDGGVAHLHYPGGAYIRQDRVEKYEEFLGNKHLEEHGLEPRYEITGHLHNEEALHDPKIKEYEIQVDQIYADPTNPASDRPHFWPLPKSQKIAKIEKEDVEHAEMFIPKHSTFFSTYFTITGLHGLHVLGGVIVFCYMMVPASMRLYRQNPEHLANRVEVAGLFWHFVDLVWIFVFPLFYLL